MLTSTPTDIIVYFLNFDMASGSGDNENVASDSIKLIRKYEFITNESGDKKCLEFDDLATTGNNKFIMEGGSQESNTSDTSFIDIEHLLSDDSTIMLNRNNDLAVQCGDIGLESDDSETISRNKLIKKLGSRESNTSDKSFADIEYLLSDVSMLSTNNDSVEQRGADGSESNDENAIAKDKLIKEPGSRESNTSDKSFVDIEYLLSEDSVLNGNDELVASDSCLESIDSMDKGKVKLIMGSGSCELNTTYGSFTDIEYLLSDDSVFTGNNESIVESGVNEHLESSIGENEGLVDEGNTSEEVDCTSPLRQGRPKRGRKRKVLNQSRADRKKLLNFNKPHINTKGDFVQEKEFDETYECPCSKRCTHFVPSERRKRLFNQFRSMGTYEGRCALIISCVSEKPKKRACSKTPKKNRMMTRTYSIFGHKVCKLAFTRTLQINHSRISLALKKQADCDSFGDGRGMTTGGRNAFSPLKRKEVRTHIESFPKYISHYTRSQTESKFLRSDLNLAKMYRLYEKKNANPVGKSFYKKVFYEDFNLRFKVPKKDTCLKCDLYNTKIKNATGAERAMIEEWHNDHLDQAKLLRLQMEEDLRMAKTVNDLEVLTFDMQKTLSLPKMPTNIAYYKRQFNVYNFGIHVGSSAKGIFNLWQENEASKGTQEVGSCLRIYIRNYINAPITKLILWSDSCGGQNRSIKLVLMLIHVLHNHPSLETIFMRYLQSGHSFLPNDSEFGDAECLMKNLVTLNTIQDIIKAMEDCRIENKFVINRMSSQHFFSVKKLEQLTTNRKVDSNKAKINWLDTHEIIIEKCQPGIIKMKKKVGGEFQSVNIEKRGCENAITSIHLDALWPNGKPISKEKYADLKVLLRLVPDEFKSFYAFLENIETREFNDDIDGFGEFIDFDLEE